MYRLRSYMCNITCRSMRNTLIFVCAYKQEQEGCCQSRGQYRCKTYFSIYYLLCLYNTTAKYILNVDCNIVLNFLFSCRKLKWLQDNVPQV